MSIESLAIHLCSVYVRSRAAYVRLCALVCCFCVTSASPTCRLFAICDAAQPESPKIDPKMSGLQDRLDASIWLSASAQAKGSWSFALPVRNVDNLRNLAKSVTIKRSWPITF